MTTPYAPGYHSVQPGQKCRILTVQIAVAEDASASGIADEISGTLTASIADPKSCILDWGYLPGHGPEDGNFATASAEPVENEIFEPKRRMTEHQVTFNPENAREFIEKYILGLQRDIPGFIDPDELGLPISGRLDLLATCAQAKPKPREYQALVVAPASEYFLLTDTGCGPSVEGPFPTAEARDEFVWREIAKGDLSFAEDDIYYLDFENGKPVWAWIPEEYQTEDED
jgi:hypothetical protein